MWSVKCEVWSVKEAVRSEKCGVWSVKCGVWSLKFGVRRVQCAVWGVECRGKDTVGTGCLWTIGHLFLGNFRRRLARVYVLYIYIYKFIWSSLLECWNVLVILLTVSNTASQGKHCRRRLYCRCSKQLWPPRLRQTRSSVYLLAKIKDLGSTRATQVVDCIHHHLSSE